jgi:hypothetical protein
MIKSYTQVVIRFEAHITLKLGFRIPPPLATRIKCSVCFQKIHKIPNYITVKHQDRCKLSFIRINRVTVCKRIAQHAYTYRSIRGNVHIHLAYTDFNRLIIRINVVRVSAHRKPGEADSSTRNALLYLYCTNITTYYHFNSFGEYHSLQTNLFCEYFALCT